MFIVYFFKFVEIIKKPKIDLETNEYEPPKDETILEQYNLFSPIELLENTKKTLCLTQNYFIFSFQYRNDVKKAEV